MISDIPTLVKVIRPAPGEAYVGIENPRGELGHYVVSDGSKIAKRMPRAGRRPTATSP